MSRARFEPRTMASPWRTRYFTGMSPGVRRSLAVTEVRVSVGHSPRELERLVSTASTSRNSAGRAPSPRACFRRRGGRPACQPVLFRGRLRLASRPVVGGSTADVDPAGQAHGPVRQRSSSATPPDRRRVRAALHVGGSRDGDRVPRPLLGAGSLDPRLRKRSRWRRSSWRRHSRSALWAVISGVAASRAERTLIVGSGAIAEATRRKIELFPDIHVQLVPSQVELSPEIPRTGHAASTGSSSPRSTSTRSTSPSSWLCAGRADQAQRGPTGPRHVRYRRPPEPRRRPPGRRVQHLGRLAFDAAS